MADITSIEVKMGMSLNTGDYSNVQASIALKADLGRGEGMEAAMSDLRAQAFAALVDCARDAHPHNMAKALKAAPGAAVSSPPTAKTLEAPKQPAESEAEKAKRTRRTKEQMAADAAKEAAASRPQSGAGKGNGKLLADDDMTLGGLDKEDTLDASENGDALLGGDEDDLLGGGEEEVVIDRDAVMSKCREVMTQRGGAALTALFKKIGANDLKSTPVSKYQELYKLALAALAT